MIRTALFSIPCLVAVIAVQGPSAASAQECESKALDALGQARRARSLQLDFSRYRGIHEERMQRLYEWLDEGDGEVGWSTQFTMAFDSYKFSDYQICTPDGAKSAQLDGGTTALTLETRNREWNSMLRLMLFDAGDSIAPDQLPRDDEGDIVFGNDATGYGSLFWGAYLQVTEWAGLTVGRVSDTERLQHIEVTETDDEVSSSTTVETNIIGDGHWYFGAALPKYNVATDFIFNGEGGLDVGLIDATAIPIPGIDEEISALAGGGYLGYENTAVAHLGASYRPWEVLETRLELGLEPWRMRSLVGRVALDWSAHKRFELGALMPGKKSKLTVGIEAGGFAEGSLFNSGHLKTELDKTHVPGIIGGGKFGLITRPIAFLVEIYGGVNPAQHLSRMVDVYDKPIFGNRLVFRAGW